MGEGEDEDKDPDDEPFEGEWVIESNVKTFSYDIDDDNKQQRDIKYVDASSLAVQNKSEREIEQENSESECTTLREFPDIHAVMKSEFGEIQQKILAPAMKDAWWNDEKKLKKYAAEFAAGQWSPDRSEGIGNQIVKLLRHATVLTIGTANGGILQKGLEQQGAADPRASVRHTR